VSCECAEVEDRGGAMRRGGALNDSIAEEFAKKLEEE
jgi:hypothetical protein